MATLEINNAQFYYELYGKGEPLILISGYSGNGNSWAPLIPKLSEHFQVLTFDNRGVGKTIDSSQYLSIELMADGVIISNSYCIW